MLYALWSIWVERGRYLPAVAAVAFSAVLTAVEIGIFLGFLDVVGVPIRNGTAEIWIMYPRTPAISTARTIPRYWADLVWSHPSIAAVDEYIHGLTLWRTESGLHELVVVMGCTLHEGSLGPIGRLSMEQRRLLSMKGNVLLDRRDSKRLEISQLGQTGQAGGRRVQVVGMVDGMRAVAGPYVVCSLETARELLRMPADQTTFLLACCTDSSKVEATVKELNQSGIYDVWTATDFAALSKQYWFTKTKAGTAIAFAALLGLVLGASVTNQVLYAAIVSNVRELAVLRALGISRRRIAVFIVQLTLVVGCCGLLLAAPSILAVAGLAKSLGTAAQIPSWLWLGTFVVVLGMALLSCLFALRVLWRLEPFDLLR